MSSTYYLLNSGNKAKKEIIIPKEVVENEPEPRDIIEPNPVDKLPDNPIGEPEELLPPANSDNPNA